MKLNAVAKGKLIHLEEVPDEMFSQKVLGDGFAIVPKDNWIYSPCDGEITMVFNTKHAIGIKTDNGKEIMLHIGIDTVTLNGEPFDVYVNVGDVVKRGELIMSSDFNLISKKGLCPTIMTVIPNAEINHLVDSGYVEETTVVVEIK